MLQTAPDYPLTARSLLRRDRPIVRITAIHTQQPTAGGGERGGHNLKQERFRLGTKKHPEGSQAVEQAAQGGCVVVFKTQQDKALSNLV